MFNAAARALLDKPLIARMSVIDPDGFPHTVPVWHELEGDELVVISERKTRKIDYLRVNPKGSLSVGGDEGNEGYLIKGTFTIEEDPDHAWMKRMVYRYTPLADQEKTIQDWLALDIIVLRLKPTRVLKVA